MYAYQKAALGGTFDRLHAGHQSLLARAFAMGRRVVIGITTDAFARSLRLAGSHPRGVHQFHPRSGLATTPEDLQGLSLPYGKDNPFEFGLSNLQSYATRRAAVQRYLRRHGWLERATLIPLRDTYGPTIADQTFDAIVVSPETEKIAKKINKKRAAIGSSLLAVNLVPWVLDTKGQPIHSSRIRAGAIGRDGTVFALPADWGVRRLPDHLRARFKRPIGRVGRIEETIQPPPPGSTAHTPGVGYRIGLIITVGDETTDTFNKLFHPRSGLATTPKDCTRQPSAGVPPPGSTAHSPGVEPYPHIAVIDYHIRRTRRYTHIIQHGFSGAVSVHTAANPRGTVTYQLYAALSSAARSAAYSPYFPDEPHPREAGVQSPPPDTPGVGQPPYTSHVVAVEGEEDLAVLPAVLVAPLGTTVLYGQPIGQIVTLTVTEKLKHQVMQWLKEFEE